MDKKIILNIIVSIILFNVLLACSRSGDEPQSSDNSLTRIDEIVSAISADSIEANIRTLVDFKTRNTLSDTTSDSVGIGAARRWIYKKMVSYSKRSGRRLKVRFDGYTQEPMRRVDTPTRVVDVVAVLPGTQLEAKDRIYVVSGHYDSRVTNVMNDTSNAPGANDDASGTAAVMEMARVMSHYKFDGTLVFLTVAGEEQGLLGSTHYAKEAAAQDKNIAGMFDNDIIGNTVGPDSTLHNDEVRVFTQGIPPGDTLSNYDKLLLYTGGENDTPSRQLGRFIYEVAEKYVANLRVNLIYRTDRYLRGGDHLPFLAQGYPAVRFTEPHENYKHQHQDIRIENGVQYGDLPKYVDYDYVRKVTSLNAAALSMLANAPARPQKVKVIVSKLENSTTLKWKPNTEPDFKGYEIVWRNTHSPYWEHAKFVGDTTRFTVKNVSKDNYLFGVRSVDEKENKSPAVYPLPTR